MASFRLTTEIAAPIERCFDLARDIDFHMQSLRHTAERAVAGRTTGLIGPGETVTWEGRHLGVRQRMTARITEFDRPRHFRDVMVEGPLRSFVHDHRFSAVDGGTVMIDEVAFTAPGGPVGRLVERLFLTRYLRRLLEARCAAMKAALEGAADSSG